MIGLFAALIASAACAPRPKARRTDLAVGDSSQTYIMCKFYVSLMEDWLKDGSTAAEIASRLEQLCQYTPEIVQPACKILIEDLMPTILDYIEQGIEALDICIRIKMCKD